MKTGFHLSLTRIFGSGSWFQPLGDEAAVFVDVGGLQRAWAEIGEFLGSVWCMDIVFSGVLICFVGV
jgi:hypothetical protein